MTDHSAQLGTAPIRSLLIKMSAPAMVGLMVQSLYNLTDTFFVGQGVGSLGIAGIVISFPIQILVMALAQMFGIGCSSIVSRRLGAGNREEAKHALGNLFTLVIILSAVIGIFGSLYLPSLLRLFGVTEGILPYASAYSRTILFGTPFFMFAMATSAVVRAEGNARVAMWTMVISAALNIVLDPLFIYGFSLGIQGAALATVLAQATTVMYLIYYFAKGRSSLRTQSHHFRLSWSIVKEATGVGLGSGLRSAASVFTMILLNRSLAPYGGDIAIATFGVINRLIMFLFLPMFGIIQGMMPIVGYNHGAGRQDRVRQVVRLSNIVTTVMSVGTSLLLIAIPALLLRAFIQDPEVVSMGAPALRIIILGFSTVGFQVVASGMYQALGKAVPALILALLRQVILLTPLILLLPRFFGLTGIWIAFPVADVAAALITGGMLIALRRQMRAHHPHHLEPPAHDEA
ncbi:MATE family efflux transporter [Candidatus Bipolaricaulota bacterium]|nr:MATE family efflux transporter [Candidatus Bipolaricaulota bacterium]